MSGGNKTPNRRKSWPQWPDRLDKRFEAIGQTSSVTFTFTHLKTPTMLLTFSVMKFLAGLGSIVFGSLARDLLRTMT